jgi:hypothetical protein
VTAAVAAGRAGTISWSRRARLAAANTIGAAHGDSGRAPEFRAARSGDSMSPGTAATAADAGTAVALAADGTAVNASAARFVVAAPAGPVLRPASVAAGPASPGGVDRSAAAGRRSAARPRVLRESDDRVPTPIPRTAESEFLALLESEPAELVGSAAAVAGNHQIATPTPRAAANAPTRPT